MNELLHHWVSDQAERRPDATAIMMEDVRVTYGELEAQSNRLAHMLRSIGCQRGDRVAFAMPKSILALVSQIGILKAGCAYVPLDPSGPAPRLAKIVDACDLRCVLTSDAAANLLKETLAIATTAERPRVGWMDGIRQDLEMTDIATDFKVGDLEAMPSSRPEMQIGEDDLAHILFTSGSTGVPKGVVITHRNVVSFVKWTVDYFGITAEDRNSGHAPLHFDLSTFDIFGTFAAGATLYPVPPRTNLLPNKLAEFMREHQLTQWFSTPSPLNLMAKNDLVAENDFPELKRLMWCGEVFPTPNLRHWMGKLPKVRFTNLYGPTEATIASSYHTLTARPETDETPVPIGRPCGGEDLLVLDKEMKPTPVSEIGDLYIAGAGLSPGYWRDAEKTAGVFIETGATDGPSRLYRTGDLAYFGEDGLVYFVGRADTQVKSRGHRIELGEVETAASALGITSAVAIVSYESGGAEGAVICCAYARQEGQDVTPAELRRRLSERLPGYMLPTRWREYSALPLNANGKYDRVALRKDFQEEEQARRTR